MGHLVRYLTLLIATACLFALSVEGACDCGYGTATGSEPNCGCQCNSGYYAPRCIFKAEEYDYVRIVVNTTVDHFSGGGLERDVRAGNNASFDSEDYFMRVREENTTALASQYPGMVIVQLKVIAPKVQPLIDDVNNGAGWAKALKLVYAAVVDIEVSDGNDFTNVKIADAAGATISLNTVGWLIGAIACMIFLCAFDRPCYENTASIVQEKQDADAAEYQRVRQEELEKMEEGTEVPPPGAPPSAPGYAYMDTTEETPTGVPIKEAAPGVDGEAHHNQQQHYHATPEEQEVEPAANPGDMKL